MAVGDAVTALVSKTNNSTLDIQPAAGVEWFIHTLVSEANKAMEVYLVDDAAGTNKKLIDSLTGGSIHGLTYRVTNIGWMQLKNVSGGTVFIGYQGVATK